MKTYFFMIAALAIAGGASMCGVKTAGAVDFSGEWILNESESETGGRGRRGGRRFGNMNVTQTEEKIIIKRTGTERDGEDRVLEEKITLDGKENELPGWRDTVRKVTADWTDGGNSLTISSEMSFSRGGRDLTMTSTAVWRLDGEQLVIKSTRTTPRGEQESKLVYDKK